MQPLTADPRQDLTEDEVRNLLQSHSTIQITYGADALDDEFGHVADISQFVGAGSSIRSDVNATVNRTCDLKIDSDVEATGWSYLSGFVRPYMTITDVASSVAATFHLGVYTLTTPSRTLGTTPATMQFSGYDLIYLLRQPVGDSYEVAAGEDPAQAAADAIGEAIPGATTLVAPSGNTTPEVLSWPLDPEQPTTWLDIINTLLASIGYRKAWVDWDGVFRIEAFVDIQDETPDWTFDVSSEVNILSEKRSQDIDVYNVPNYWRFVMANLADTPVEGTSQFTWTDSSRVNPGSTQNRGRIIRHIESVTAADYNALVEYAQRKIVDTLNPAETFKVESQPFPLAWHLDIIQYADTALEDFTVPGSSERTVLATEWTLPLDGDGEMQWSWQTITDQNADDAIAEVEDESGEVL